MVTAVATVIIVTILIKDSLAFIIIMFSMILMVTVTTKDDMVTTVSIVKFHLFIILSPCRTLS